MQGDEKRKGRIVNGFFQECPQAQRILVGVNAFSVLYFNRDPAGPDGNDEIDFGLSASGRKMRHIEIGNRSQVITENAFRQVASEIREVGVACQSFGR